MSKIAIAVHGGVGWNIPFIKKHVKGYEDGLRDAIMAGYQVLKKGGSSLNAVEESVKKLEDNYLFNAGRGSALNLLGEVEMDASIMDGKTLKAGAVSMVRSVRNPVTLARCVMNKTKHVFLSGYGALDLAKSNEILLEPDSYFITDHQYRSFLKSRDTATIQKALQKRIHGTVGAVALDARGNLAAATSTGGTSNCLPGRIGDSCVIGAGCYANNQTCAVSGTGDGEVLITGVIAHTISMLVELEKMPLDEACDYVINTRNASIKGDIGVISVDTSGNFGVCFNSKIMKRAWMTSEEDLQVRVMQPNCQK